MAQEKSTRAVPRGTVIFREGDRGNRAYIIEQGSVRISTERDGETIVLATRQAGEIFGEMAIVDDRPRSATATALEDCELFCLSRGQLQARMNSLDPVLRMVLGVVLERFRDTLTRIGEDKRTESVSPESPATAAVVEQIHAHQGAIERIKLELDLKQAIDRRDFELFYQPIVSLKNRRIVSFEGLIRWRHPEQGILPPGSFLPVAEESGLLPALAKTTLFQACNAVKTLMVPCGDWKHPPTISVNIAVQQLANPHFVTELQSAVDAFDIAPGSLILEITETALIVDPERALKTLLDCRERGFSIAVDDFGTGYSSLSYLCRYPLKELKIDRSFVAPIQDDKNSLEVVRAMIGLAKNLDMEVVAEGIETEEQARILLELGCDYAQGFYFAKPAPLEHNLNLLTAGPLPARREDIISGISGPTALAG